MKSIFSIIAIILFTAILCLKTAFCQTTGRLNVGGGGHNHGLIIHPAVSNLVYARQDVSGLLRWEPSTSSWKQLFDFMPAKWFNTKGCAGIAIDPSAGNDVTRQNTIFATTSMYMVDIQMSPEGNGVYRSFDRGESWVKIWDGVKKFSSPFYQYSFASNSGGHYYGENIAVDPSNNNILYVGTNIDGLYRTKNANAGSPTFVKISGSPEGFNEDIWNATGVKSIVFDNRLGTVGSGSDLRTKVVYLGVPRPEEKYVVAGKKYGVFMSTDGGETFTCITDLSGGPKTSARIVLGKETGSILVTCFDGTNGIYKYNGNNWSVLNGTSSASFRGIDTHPSDRNIIAASGKESGNDDMLYISNDGGNSWSKKSWRTNNYYISKDNWTWTDTDNGKYPWAHIGSAPSLQFDPFKSSSLWSGEVFGVWSTDNVFANSIQMTGKLKGYETTVMWSLCVPPSSTKIYATCADVNGFIFENNQLDVTPSQQLLAKVFPNDRPFGDALVSDIEYAPSNPSSVVVLRATEAGYSSPYPRLYASQDGGNTWTSGIDFPPLNVAGAPTWAGAAGPGKIAISSTDKNRWVVMGSFRTPYFTTNGFSANPTWTASSGIANCADDVNPYSVNLMRLEADAVNGMTFYTTRKNGSTLEMWVSSDGGASFSRPSNQTNIPSADDYLIESIKNAQGQSELWVSVNDGGLWKSTDAAKTFTRVNSSNISFVRGFSFGKIASGTSNPMLFVAGTVKINGSDKDGVFMSKDMGNTFEQLTTDGKSLFGGLRIYDMVGDPNIEGRVYIATNGTGVVYCSASNGSPSNVAVTGVSVSPTSASVAVGATTALTATVAPSNATNKNVTWSSSNTSVATVSSTGVVTGVSAGSAIITVTTQDGARTATSAITVTATTGSTNIAPSGTGTLWSDIPSASSTSDASKSTNVAINNSNTSVDVIYSDATAAGNWQAAGIVWSTAQSGITSVKFYNGTCVTLGDNGVFSAGVKIQQSTDGTTWTDISSWSISPAYQYTAASSNVVYTFSGASLSNVRGIRVIGQVRTNDSWSVKVKEVEVFTGTTSNVAVTGVSVSPTSASVGVGATTALTATVAPSNATNKNVTWSSSNTSVATVSSTGVVTGVSAGSATITVTTQDGARTATSTITVTATNVAVTGVSVSPTSASVAVGATTSLTATVAPSNATNKNVTWSSSNTSVATVSSTGVVTGVAAGSATITVTTQDGARTATSAITVTGGSTGSSATINFTSSAAGNLANPYNDASGYTLTGATSSGVAEPLVVLSNAGNNVARNTNFQSRITLTKTGGGSFNLTSLKYASDPWGGLADATITGTLAAGGTVTASISSASTTLQTSTLNWTGVTNVVIDFATGTTTNYGMIDDIVVGTSAGARVAFSSNSAAQADRLNLIYPNPAKSKAMLQIETKQAALLQIQVVDIKGAVLQKISKNIPGGVNQLSLDMSNLKAGIYFVKVMNGKRIICTKQMVKE